MTTEADTEKLLKLSEEAVRSLLWERRRHHDQLKRDCTRRGSVTADEYRELNVLMGETTVLASALNAKTYYRAMLQRERLEWVKRRAQALMQAPTLANFLNPKKGA